MLRHAKKRNIKESNDQPKKSRRCPKISDEINATKDKGLEEVVFGGLIPFEEDCIDKSVKQTEFESAWSDDDDKIENIQCKSKLKINVSSRKNQFEKALGPTPQWAQISSETDCNRLPSKYLSSINVSLPTDSIDVVQCVDINKKQRSLRPLQTCEFHSSAQIAMTASKDCSVNLFQIDGKSNAKIHGLFLENFPITCAHFLKNGKEILITSNLHWYYNYDMISGKIIKLPYVKGISDTKLHKFKVSPNGKHLIFFSKYGKMHVLDSISKELITTLKMNGTVADVAFMKNGQYMLSIGDEGIVYVWDMSARQCIHTFIDEGCVNGTTIAVSPSNNKIACGSYSGIVNLYDGSCITQSKPNVLKSFMNLQTPVSALEFNSTSELLAMSSNAVKYAIKFAHMQSLTTFSNFPGVTLRNIQLAHKIGFSPNSGFFCIGNSAGRALLFRLNHYQNY